MQETAIQQSKLEEALYEADLLDYESNPIIPAYSGRNMYGENCVALRLSHGELIRLAMEVQHLFEHDRLTEDERDDLAKMFQAVREDTLGYDTVLYFPGFVLG